MTFEHTTLRMIILLVYGFDHSFYKMQTRHNQETTLISHFGFKCRKKKKRTQICMCTHSVGICLNIYSPLLSLSQFTLSSLIKAAIFPGGGCLTSDTDVHTHRRSQLHTLYYAIFCALPFQCCLFNSNNGTCLHVLGQVKIIR